MKKKSRDSQYTKEVFDKIMETHKGKEINMYALFVQGFNTGRNYQHKKEREMGSKNEMS